VVEDKDGGKDEKGGESANDNPHFQFTGDENFDDSGDDEGGEDEDANPAEAEDEEDDFVNAYEVLDLARILLLRRLEETQATDGKGKSTEESEDVKQVKERLADTHDLQAEISLEGERFPNAVVDLKASAGAQAGVVPERLESHCRGTLQALWLWNSHRSHNKRARMGRPTKARRRTWTKPCEKKLPRRWRPQSRAVS
jgi:HAT1-interacting factor 1